MDTLYRIRVGNCNGRLPRYVSSIFSYLTILDPRDMSWHRQSLP